MRFSIVALALSLRLTAQDISTVQDPLAASDAQIFQAVLGHTVRPYVVGLSNRMDAQPPYPLLVVNETIHLCGRETYAIERCFDSALVTAYFMSRETGNQRRLSESFYQRNGPPVPIPPGIGSDVVLVPRASMDDALNERKDSAIGFLAFSNPGYSPDGNAKVWVSFICRGCSSRGWYFTLHRAGANWVVDRVSQTILNGPAAERLKP